MYLDSAVFENFRNIEKCTFSFSKGVNIFYGNNAQGKTNILEGIWLFSGLKSFRGAKDSELIKFGEQYSKIRLSFDDTARSHSSEITLSNANKKVFHNGIELKGTAELIGTFYAVIFSPVHLSLIKDGPAARRKFLDTAICQIKPAYAGYLAGFKRALMQRNALLKDIRLSSELYDLLESLNEQLAKYSAPIISERIKYIDMLYDIIKYALSHSFGKSKIIISVRQIIFSRLGQSI